MASMQDIVRLYQLEQKIILAKKHGNLSIVLSFYNEILQIKNEISNRLGLAKTYADIAEMLNKYGDPKGALKSYLCAAEIAQNSKNIEFNNLIHEKITKLKENSLFT